ncbi:LPS translocon maturation chaperone LptM [Burkholderia sp. DN3021]|uniref:LPS translocon maturation chaperone LptM n=1 Tax=Burkholderia TaxID=32008 RepID=UPI0015891A6B|nr:MULTISPECIES: lipoprotein [Burkholderia cepacia complex]
MRVVFRMSAIVAALAILAGCGQSGPLYLPTVPPLPKPIQQQDTPPSDVKPTDENASSDSVPDSSGTPLMLTPELSSDASKMPAPASGSAVAQ